MKDEESWPESFKEISGEDFIAEKRRPDFERDLNDMLPEWLLARVRIAIRDDASRRCWNILRYLATLPSSSSASSEASGKGSSPTQRR